MSTFLTIILKLIPLYIIIALGFVAAQKLKAQKETIAKLLIYIIAPVVVFYGTYTAEMNFANLSLPILFLVVCCVLSLIFLAIGKGIYKTDTTKNILAFTAGDGNTGYFGFPVIAAVLGEKAFSLAVLSALGFILYENSLGFFITAKANYSAKQSLLRIIKLPSIYAFILGILFNIFHIQFPDAITTTIVNFKDAYTLLGMMMIGMGLSTINIRNIDFKFISLSFLAKFIAWPLVIFGIIFLDTNFIHIYTPAIHDVLIVMSIVPLAANTVAYATELKVHPDKAAIAVLLSTLFALFYIPFMTGLFIS